MILNCQPSEELKTIREHTFQVLDKYSNVNVYTNINKLYRIEKNIKQIIQEDNITNIDTEALFLANYLNTLEQAENNLKELDFKKVSQDIGVVTSKLKDQFDLDDHLADKAQRIAIQALPLNSAALEEAKILSDASVMDFACDQGRDRMKRMYEQMVLRDFNISKTNWYDIILPILENYRTYTNYGKREIQPLIEKLHKTLKKERKDIENRNDLLLQKELEISEEEIKKLKKDLTKTKNRDDRGIQTLFRNTSRNHYTLNRMVDGKATIMITVNSIILSLILGGIIGESKAGFIGYIPSMIFSVANLLSITFAIIAITPNRTQGNFTESEIRSKKGNLLYFGNFHNMHYRDFEWAFLQILRDKDYLYTSMIRDYYYQSQILHKKYKHIRISLNAFLLGLGIAILSQLVINCL